MCLRYDGGTSEIFSSACSFIFFYICISLLFSHPFIQGICRRHIVVFYFIRINPEPAQSTTTTKNGNFTMHSNSSALLGTLFYSINHTHPPARRGARPPCANRRMGLWHGEGFWEVLGPIAREPSANPQPFPHINQKVYVEHIAMFSHIHTHSHLCMGNG